GQGVEHAGDVLADMLCKRRLVVDQRGEIDAPVGQCGEDRAGKRRHEIDDRGDGRTLKPVRRSDPVETAQAIIELHWKRRAAHRPHSLVRQNLDRPAKTLHEALEVELMAYEVEFDAG